MERTVPHFATDEVELYLRTIYSLLRSTTEVQIRTLEEVHAAMNSSMHQDARNANPDTSAFIYAILRLPDCILNVKSIILGQSASVFARHGYADIESWHQVTARARRRRCYYDGNETLACYIASQSDIEDVIPVLTAYQLEWNKIHILLQNANLSGLHPQESCETAAFQQLAATLGISVEDLERLQTIWGKDFLTYLQTMQSRRCEFGIRSLSGSLSEYWRATGSWWENIEKACPEVLERPVYFVSSNTHSIVNLISGYAISAKDKIINLLAHNGNSMLMTEWEEIQKRETPSNQQNFLFYALKKVQQTTDGKYMNLEQANMEVEHGITRVPSLHSFDVEAQVIDLAKLDASLLDPRLGEATDLVNIIKKTNALVINIDYPLGFGAYHILTALAENIADILGVYIMGKAATLNGVRGDVMIPSVVQDEHSENTYLFKNVFQATDVTPFLTFGTVLDNQKAVTALGTFLQNPRLTNVMYREGYTDIEMEAGPYLSAIYEMYRPTRHPVNEIVNLYGVPFDIGILHYASDTPMSKGKNLGAGALSYEGMDSTYATSIAILRRILYKEQKRLRL
ncbi:MAG: hypothetical protein VB013_13180 [Anaerolineaceae bacterium]|nr:hypothetical protein [Anaerolineaceae bacterium]